MKSTSSENTPEAVALTTERAPAAGVLSESVAAASSCEIAVTADETVQAEAFTEANTAAPNTVPEEEEEDEEYMCPITYEHIEEDHRVRLEDDLKKMETLKDYEAPWYNKEALFNWFDKSADQIANGNGLFTGVSNPGDGVALKSKFAVDWHGKTAIDLSTKETFPYNTSTGRQNHHAVARRTVQRRRFVSAARRTREKVVDGLVILLILTLGAAMYIFVIEFFTCFGLCCTPFYRSCCE